MELTKYKNALSISIILNQHRFKTFESTALQAGLGMGKNFTI